MSKRYWLFLFVFLGFQILHDTKKGNPKLAQISRAKILRRGLTKHPQVVPAFRVLEGQGYGAYGDDCIKSVCTLKTNVLKFFLIGDWGGTPMAPYRSIAQSNTAEAMGSLGLEFVTHFQISLGDNFYMKGVKDDHDFRFKETFENVYNHSHLHHTPWYIIAGNHDHYGNVDAEVAYSQRSRRWNFPKLYYVVKYQLRNGMTIDFVMIDTMILCDTDTPKVDKSMKIFMDYLRFKRNPNPHIHQEEREKHWKWIEYVFQNSMAHYIFVAGHYPIYSVGSHGPTQCLVNRLNPLLFKYQVSAYFSGHDHNLEHLQIRRPRSLYHFNYVVSGNGAFADPLTPHEKDVSRGSSKFFYSGDDNVGGLVYAMVRQNEAKFAYYSGNKSKLHEFIILPRYF